MSKPTLSHTTDDGSNSLTASSSRRGTSDSATANIQYSILTSFRPWGSGKFTHHHQLKRCEIQVDIHRVRCLPMVRLELPKRAYSIPSSYCRNNAMNIQNRYTMQGDLTSATTGNPSPNAGMRPCVCSSDFFTKWSPPVQNTVWKCRM